MINYTELVRGKLLGMGVGQCLHRRKGSYFSLMRLLLAACCPSIVVVSVLSATMIALRDIYIYIHTSTFELLDKPWSQVSSLPPGSCLQFLSRIGFSTPTVRRFFFE